MTFYIKEEEYDLALVHKSLGTGEGRTENLNNKSAWVENSKCPSNLLIKNKAT